MVWVTLKEVCDRLNATDYVVGRALDGKQAADGRFRSEAVEEVFPQGDYFLLADVVTQAGLSLDAVRKIAARAGVATYKSKKGAAVHESIWQHLARQAPAGHTTLHDFARAHYRSTRTMQRLVASKNIEHRRVGRQRFYPVGALEALLKKEVADGDDD